MNKKIHILHLEDEENVAALVKFLLEKEKIAAHIVRATNQDEFVTELYKNKFDIILADYELPDYNGFKALSICKQVIPDVPFIIFSGVIKEELAIESLRNGATDYVLKQQVDKLIPAIKRAIKERNEKLAHKATLAALRESELKFRSIVESAKDAIVLINQEGIVISWNKAAETIFGYSAKEILQREVTKIMPFSLKNEHQNHINRFLTQQTSNIIGKSIELTGMRKNSQEFPIELSLSHWQIEKNHYFCAIIRDISSRKKIEAALKASEEQYRTLIETMMDGVGLTDFNEKFVYVNKALCELLGYNQSELIGHSVYEFVLSPSKNQIQKETNRRKSGEKAIYEVQLKTKNKGPKYFLLSASPYLDTEGNPIGTIAVIHDITNRKITEQKIKFAQEETASLLSSMSSILIGIDEADRITHWNLMAEKTFNIKANNIIGKPFLDCGIQWDWQAIIEQIAACRESEAQQELSDIKYTTPSNKEGFLMVLVNPIESKDKAFNGFLLVINDVTERKILKDQLLQAQKLESIGQLAAGIAHEINTPVQFIGDNLHFFKDSFSEIVKILKDSQNLVEELNKDEQLSKTYAGFYPGFEKNRFGISD